MRALSSCAGPGSKIAFVLARHDKLLCRKDPPAGRRKEPDTGRLVKATPRIHTSCCTMCVARAKHTSSALQPFISGAGALSSSGSLFSCVNVSKQSQTTSCLSTCAKRMDQALQTGRSPFRFVSVAIVFAGFWINDRIVGSVGFTKTSQRVILFWDVRHTHKAYHRTDLDVSASVLVPFYDADLSILYLAGACLCVVDSIK